MKSQGLPINFIVIAALAILILILAAGFVIAGGSSFGSAVSPAAARANCKNVCAAIQREATQQNSSYTWQITVPGKPEYAFCTTQDIKGQGNVTCLSMGEDCYVTFGDSVQRKITCT